MHFVITIKYICLAIPLTVSGQQRQKIRYINQLENKVQEWTSLLVLCFPKSIAELMRSLDSMLIIRLNKFKYQRFIPCNIRNQSKVTSSVCFNWCRKNIYLALLHFSFSFWTSSQLQIPLICCGTGQTWHHNIAVLDKKTNKSHSGIAVTQRYWNN